MKKYILLFGILAFAASCTIAEPPIYSLQEPRINFYVELERGQTRVIYPDALRRNYDFGSFANFLNRGLAGFSNLHEFEIMVQTQGFTITEDRRVAFRADSVQLGSGVNVRFRDNYIVRSGEGIAGFSFDVEEIQPGDTTRVVLMFDYDRSQFLRGVIERQYYTFTFTNSRGEPGGVPTTINGFGPNLADWWEQSFAPTYGNLSFTKLKFMSLVLGGPNLQQRLNWTPAQVNLLRTYLAQYKELNAEDPVRFPPLYEEGTQTWISFPD
jgi:hypothetical protein